MFRFFFRPAHCRNFNTGKIALNSTLWLGQRISLIKGDFVADWRCCMRVCLCHSPSNFYIYSRFSAERQTILWPHGGD